jgi:ABC transporter substrate binding protein (PQQ-dependent alcohol dehydrogenase system)
MRGLGRWLCLLLLWAASPATAAELPRAIFAYVGLKDDPRHAPIETYANLVLRPGIVPLDGAKIAMRDARIIGRALKLEFALDATYATDVEEVIVEIARLRRELDVRFVIADLPAPLLDEVGKRTVGQELLLLNVSATEDWLRGAACQPHVLHVIPSDAMLADGLGQYAAYMQWRELLLLAGPSDADAARARSVANGLHRFGGRVVDARRFTSSNDPRERELNNIRLLTQGVAYDAVVVIDVAGELARYVPYQAVLPRPVIGNAGLEASAWHWAFERHGAPQLNQRFARQVDGRRHMRDAEWAAWAAVRSLIEVYARTRSTDYATLVGALRGGDLTLDVYKGPPASFRPWDNQMRQPILLHTSDAVIARAPLEGFLHESNDLDTLGVDRPQSACRF